MDFASEMNVYSTCVRERTCIFLKMRPNWHEMFSRLMFIASVNSLSSVRPPRSLRTSLRCVGDSLYSSARRLNCRSEITTIQFRNKALTSLVRRFAGCSAFHCSGCDLGGILITCRAPCASRRGLLEFSTNSKEILVNLI